MTTVKTSLHRDFPNKHRFFHEQMYQNVSCTCTEQKKPFAFVVVVVSKVCFPCNPPDYLHLIASIFGGDGGDTGDYIKPATKHTCTLVLFKVELLACVAY